MIKFIKLTEANTEIGDKDIILNIAHIQYIQMGKRGTNVRVVMIEEKQYFFVTQSVEQIWEMVNEYFD